MRATVVATILSPYIPHCSKNDEQSSKQAYSSFVIDHLHSLDARSDLTTKVQLQMHYWQVCNNLEISLEKDLL